MGQVEGKTGVSTLARMPPLTTLAHVAVGETREVGGREEMCDGWRSACPAGSPATPVEGEAGRAWRLDRHRGGETGSGAGVRLQEERSSLPDEG